MAKGGEPFKAVQNLLSSRNNWAVVKTGVLEEGTLKLRIEDGGSPSSILDSSYSIPAAATS